MERPYVILPNRYYVFASGDPQEGSPEQETIETIETMEETQVAEDSLVSEVKMTNHLLVGIIMFLGIFFGAFCMAHLFNRIRKD